jgi:hypothetical protein
MVDAPPLNLPIASTPPVAPPPPVTPPAPEKLEYMAQMRTMKEDVHEIQIGQRPHGTATHPGELTPALPPSPVIIPPPIQAPSSSFTHKLLYAVSGIVIVGLIWAIGTSIFGNTTDTTPTPTPTPSASAAPTQTALPSRTPIGVKTLETYLGTAVHRIDISQGSLASRLGALPPSSTKLVAVTPLLSGKPADARIGLQTIFSTIPTALLDAVASEWTLGIFGQTELFTPQGQTIANTTPQSRTVLIVEIANVNAATSALTAWEAASLVPSGASVFGYTPTTPAFSQGSYKNIGVHYQNFPTADRSIDYALVLASNGKNYLVMTGSRQSIFAAIDLLQK